MHGEHILAAEPAHPTFDVEARTDKLAEVLLFVQSSGARPEHTPEFEVMKTRPLDDVAAEFMGLKVGDLDKKRREYYRDLAEALRQRGFFKE